MKKTNLLGFPILLQMLLPMLLPMLPIILCLGLGACAKIPQQSVDLMEAMQKEGEKMHQLNMSMVNQLFVQQKKEVKQFVQEVYSPQLIRNFKTSLPNNTNYQEHFEDLTMALMPLVQNRQDSLIEALQTEKEKIQNKLSANYLVYTEAGNGLKKLLSSASKIEQQRTNLLQSVKTISNNQIDLLSLQAALEKYAHAAGSAQASIEDLQKAIEPLFKK